LIKKLASASPWPPKIKGIDFRKRHPNKKKG